MLKKLLKYDMIAIKRVWLLQAIIVLALSVPCGIALRFIDAEHSDSMMIYEGLVTMFFVTSIILVALSYFLTKGMVYLHFYKNFFTDEGYLTFTLPVSRKTLLFSKMTSAMIWSGAQLLVYVLFGAVLLLIAPAPARGELLTLAGYRSLGKLISEVWKYVGAWLILYVMEGLALLALIEAFEIATAYFCITLGSIVVKKAKLLLAIGVYYAIQSVLWQFFQISVFAYLTPVGFLSATTLITGIVERLYVANCANVGIALVLFIAILVAAALLLTMYYMTLDKIERKLNLA